VPAVGVLTLELRFEESHSLKDKRHFIQSLKDRLRRHHNVSVSEIDFQDLWQHALLAAVTVSPSRQYAAQVLEAVESEVASQVGGSLVNAVVEWLA